MLLSKKRDDSAPYAMKWNFQALSEIWSKSCITSVKDGPKGQQEGAGVHFALSLIQLHFIIPYNWMSFFLRVLSAHLPLERILCSMGGRCLLSTKHHFV